MVPKPRINLTRYHGVFAPNSAQRAEITPSQPGKGSNRLPLPILDEYLGLKVVNQAAYLRHESLVVRLISWWLADWSWPQPD